jgi:hypothetical protein
MKASFNDHVITTRAVETDRGAPVPPGTHGFVVRVIEEPAEAYVVELYLGNWQETEETVLSVLIPLDFDLA